MHLDTTLLFKEVNNENVPFQNGNVLPSFDPQKRLSVSLGGNWKKKRFQADHEQTMEERTKNWIEKVEKEGQGITGLHYDDEQLITHSIPLPENKMTGEASTNGVETYEDGVWYRRKFKVPSDWTSKQIALKAYAISYIADIWVNGQYVGVHEGGYTPFSFNITNFVQLGEENVIVIRVDNPPWGSRNDIIPATVGTDFFNYTGIIHDLFIEATPAIQISRCDIVPVDTTGQVRLKLVVENRSELPEKVMVKVNLYEGDQESPQFLQSPYAEDIIGEKRTYSGRGEQEVQVDANDLSIWTTTIQIDDPKLWEVRNPNLYVCGVELVQGEDTVDRFFSQFGIRTVATEGTKITLNNEPIFLVGLARHEEWPNFGRTATFDRIVTDLLQMRDLSINFVRTSHYPNHIYTYIILDRLGLTAKCEIPLWQFEREHYEAEETRLHAQQMWREMILSNFNRPSIILWSTQNESVEVALRKRHNERLVNDLRGKYNDGRLITQSAAADQPGYWDESMEPLDVAGWTMYFGVFHGSTPYEGTKQFLENAHKAWPNKPILNTEYGYWSREDGGEEEKQVYIYSETQRALLEKATVSPDGQVNEEGYLAGINYWSVYDWYINHNEFYQTMGLFQMDRKTTKPVFELLKRDYRKLTNLT
ncbi:glycoside hydrolase family 2 TIM barrel-domain containing protein [Bacillus spongiae]|uniref:Glycoside hydrolase family 2 TIM barrel-domain containing protein n=1 Tax=Bacillus spongiae TaxID=2683610 RepID=A0ABU8H8I3_9BACI